MEITGVDTLIVVSLDARPAVAAFLREMRQRWPDAVLGFDDGAGDTIADPEDVAAFPARGEVTIARDAAMDEHWAEHGYAPTPDGAGPVALFYELRRNLIVRVDVAGQGGLDDGPLSGWTDVELVLPEATTLTLVTHAAPDSDGFCAAVLTHLQEALGYRKAGA